MFESARQSGCTLLKTQDEMIEFISQQDGTLNPSFLQIPHNKPQVSMSGANNRASYTPNPSKKVFHKNVAQDEKLLKTPSPTAFRTDEASNHHLRQ
jgi:hypothetical protein